MFDPEDDSEQQEPPPVTSLDPGMYEDVFEGSQEDDGITFDAMGD